MFASLKERLAGLPAILFAAGLALAAPGQAGTLTITDAYTADLPVKVQCPGGQVQTITGSQPVFCTVQAGNTVTLTNQAGVSCTARIAASGAVDQRKSTCVSGSYAPGTLALTATQGVYPGVLWTFIDGYAGDWGNGGVTVACPNNINRAITSSSPVSCAVPAHGEVTFSLGSKTACTASFGAGSKYLPKASTCLPASYASNTLVFPASQGVIPPAAPNQVIQIGFAGGGVSATCVSGSCGTVTDQQVTLSTPLEQNGAMTLGFSTGTGTAQVSCHVAFYGSFIDDRNTTCQGVVLASPSGPGTSYQLSFPSASVDGGAVGQLVVYPKPPPPAAPVTQVGSRTLTFVNRCGQPVWFGLVSGTVGSPAGGSGGHGNAQPSGNLCAGGSGSDGGITCPYGTTCRYVNQTQAYCFYNPADPAMPDGGNPLQQFMLAADGGSSSVTLPIYQGNAVVFSGGASARLGCQDATGKFVQCAVGNCNEGNNALGCGYTSGTSNGATIAEFTLSAQDIDYYDISIINGAHVPMSMAPAAGQTPDSSKRGGTVGYYWCGAPGAAAAGGAGQPGCDWNLGSHLKAAAAIPRAKARYFVNVTAPAVAQPIVLSKLNYCASDADCTGQQSCGLSLDLLSLIPVNQRASLFSATGANGKKGPYTCGKRLGYSTPVDICSLVTSGADGFLNCSSTLTQTSPAGGQVNLSSANLYACDGPTDNCVKSASDYAGTVCCGCTTWSSLDAGIQSGMPTACTYNGTTAYGTNSNSAWYGGSGAKPDVRGKITFLKQACPTAYAYQFDDATSTFNCYVDGAGAAAAYNATNYTITFCPGGTALR
jgi:hypothetical protein